MHFFGMETFTTNKDVRHQIELEIECILKAARDKSQSTITVTQSKPKVKNKKSAMGKPHVKNQAISKVNKGDNKEKEVSMSEEGQ